MKKVPCEIYSRVVGYFRPVQNWNIGKQAEFRDRLVYNTRKSEVHADLFDAGVLIPASSTLARA